MTWAILLGLRIREAIAENYRKFKEALRTIIEEAGVEAEDAQTEMSRAKRERCDQDIPVSWRQTMDIWFEYTERQKAAESERAESAAKTYQDTVRDNIASIQVMAEENRAKRAEMEDEFGERFWELSRSPNRSRRSQEFWETKRTNWGREPARVLGLRRAESKLTEAQSIMEIQLRRGIELQTIQRQDEEKEERAAKRKSKRKKEKKDRRKAKKRKRKDAKDDEDMLIQTLETTETATAGCASTGGSGAGTGAGENKEAAADMVGTGTSSGSGAGTGARSGEPAYRAESVAETEPVDAREERKNKREVQRVKALEASAARKVQVQKTAADTAGPGPGCINNTATGGKQAAQQAMEDIMGNMCIITGCTEDQCAETFATHSLPCRSTGEIWHLVRKSLCPDGASETQGSLAQE